jgi:hypothetical protein
MFNPILYSTLLIQANRLLEATTIEERKVRWDTWVAAVKAPLLAWIKLYHTFVPETRTLMDAYRGIDFMTPLFEMCMKHYAIGPPITIALLRNALDVVWPKMEGLSMPLFKANTDEERSTEFDGLVARIESPILLTIKIYNDLQKMHLTSWMFQVIQQYQRVTAPTAATSSAPPPPMTPTPPSPPPPPPPPTAPPRASFSECFFNLAHDAIRATIVPASTTPTPPPPPPPPTAPSRDSAWFSECFLNLARDAIRATIAPASTTPPPPMATTPPPPPPTAPPRESARMHVLDDIFGGFQLPPPTAAATAPPALPTPIATPQATATAKKTTYPPSDVPSISVSPPCLMAGGLRLSTTTVGTFDGQFIYATNPEGKLTTLGPRGFLPPHQNIQFYSDTVDRLRSVCWHVMTREDITATAALAGVTIGPNTALLC